MSVFQRLDNQVLSAIIQRAENRVLLCIPGFDDGIGSALVNAHRRLGPGAVTVVVDASDNAARLGYGHFDALKMVTEHGLEVRVEPGLRLAVAIVDGRGWCFATPPLLVDATMEGAMAPNAITLSTSQISAVLTAIVPPGNIEQDPDDDDMGESDGASRPVGLADAEIGRAVLCADAVAGIEQVLAANPPQRFDVARKVGVFNSYLEFVEIKVTGVHIERHRIALPADLLISVDDRTTRDRIAANFRLIDGQTDLARDAGRLQEQANALRATHTRNLPRFGAVILRNERTRLQDAFAGLERAIEKFSSGVRDSIESAIAESKERLVDALLPAIHASPPSRLLAETVGPPSDAALRAWLDARISQALPPVERLVTQMQATLTFKAITYETLNDPEFQRAVVKAYPYVDFDKPFEEFTAAKATP